jgi:hypothetical protein
VTDDRRPVDVDAITRALLQVVRDRGGTAAEILASHGRRRFVATMHRTVQHIVEAGGWPDDLAEPTDADLSEVYRRIRLQAMQ